MFALLSRLKLRPTRRWRRVGVIVLSLIIAAFVVDCVLGSIFRARLASRLHEATGADLHAHFAWYLPPWGVSLHGVRVTKSQPDGELMELFTASRLVLKLAEEPKGGRFAIRSLGISNGEFSVENDRRGAMAKVGGTLIFHAGTLPQGDWRQATYAGDVDLGEGQLELPALKVNTATAKLHIDKSAGNSEFSITIQNLFAASGATELQIDNGTFSVNPNGQHWELANLVGRLDINGGIAALDRVNLKGRIVFTGRAGGSTALPKDASMLSAVHHEFIAYARDVSVRPPAFPVPVEHIEGGPISFRVGLVRFANLSGLYGGDQVLLDEAHITLDDPAQNLALADLRRVIRIDGIAGTLVCRQPGPAYPAGLGKVIAQLHPSGNFAIGGGSWYAINRRLPDEVGKPKPDYFFRVSTAGGAFALTDRHIPLTDIHGDSTISPMLVDISELRGNFLGGTVIAGTKVTPIRPIHYDGVATFYNVNLETAAHDLRLTEKKPLVGLMYLKTHAWGDGAGGTVPPIKSLSATGEFEIVNGNFGEVGTIRAATSNVTKPGEPLDGEGAGVFTIADEKLTLGDCVVGNPTFGLQGTGTIGFDKSLDLHAVAAPLGDWQANLKQSNVPVLEDVGSDIAGAIQALFAGAQRAVLWDVHICGTTSAPKVEQTPAPIITRPVAAIFGQLIRGSKGSRLIDQIRPAEKTGKSKKK